MNRRIWSFVGVAALLVALGCGKKGPEENQDPAARPGGGSGGRESGAAASPGHAAKVKAIEDAFAASEACQKIARCCAEPKVAEVAAMASGPCRQIKGLADGEQGVRGMSSPGFVTRTCDNMVQALGSAGRSVMPKEDAPAACAWMYP